MGTTTSGSSSRQALVLSLVALALPVVALIPGFIQEVLTMILLGLAGGVVAVFALVTGIAALRAKRAAHESVAMAVAAIVISLFPMLGALLLIPSLGCYFGESCGGG